MEDPNSDFWKEVVGEEMMSLKKNGTWILVDKPEDQKTIGCKWMFKRNPEINGVEPPRYKGRLVAKGFSKGRYKFSRNLRTCRQACIYKIHII